MVKRTLSVVCIGHVHTEAIQALTPHLSRLEQVMTNSPAEIHRAIEAAANDWILIVRAPETIDAALAAEIADSGAVWGYRIRTVSLYGGRQLRLGDEGTLRLFHRRHRRGTGVEGPVIRLENPFYAQSFASPREHRAYLEQNAVPHSWLRRVLIFLRNARTLDTNTLRYLWTEAAFDHGERPPSGRRL